MGSVSSHNLLCINSFNLTKCIKRFCADNIIAQPKDTEYSFPSRRFQSNCKIYRGGLLPVSDNSFHLIFLKSVFEPFFPAKLYACPHPLYVHH